MSKPVAYVINLERRPERWAKMQELWHPWFDLVRIPAVDMPGNGAAGCKLSHRMIAAHFLKNDDFVIVMEDDCEMTPWFPVIGMACIKEAQHHVDKWDACNCGPFLDLTPIKLGRATLSPTESPLFFRPSVCHQTHFMLYNKRSIPLLNASMKNPMPVDMWIGREGLVWVPFRLLATQADSHSDIRQPFPGQSSWYKLSDDVLQEAVSDEEILSVAKSLN